MYEVITLSALLTSPTAATRSWPGRRCQGHATGDSRVQLRASGFDAEVAVSHLAANVPLPSFFCWNAGSVSHELRGVRGTRL